MGAENSNEAGTNQSAKSANNGESERSLGPMMQQSSQYVQPIDTPKSTVSFADPNISVIVSNGTALNLQPRPLRMQSSTMESQQVSKSLGAFPGLFSQDQPDSKRSANTAANMDQSLDLNGAAISFDLHQNSKVQGTQINSDRALSIASQDFSQVDWAKGVLVEMADPEIAKYLLPHEHNFVKHTSWLNTRKFSAMLDQIATSGAFHQIWRQPQLALYFNEGGTQFEPSVPCVKIEFFFDPAFSLQQVIESIKSEKNRRRWDPFLKSSKVAYQADSGRLQVVYTEMKPFLDRAPRHFFDKKIHFQTEELLEQDLDLDQVNIRDPDGKRMSLMSQGPVSFYTYISACKKAPRVRGKDGFQSFSSKIGSSSGSGIQVQPSQEAKNILGMHKFELVELQGNNDERQHPQVMVTMVSQVDLLNDEDNYEIYEGMHKSMAITALKKNVAEFHTAWIEFLRRQYKIAK